MRNTFAIIILVTCTSVFSCKNKKEITETSTDKTIDKYTIKGIVTQSHSYCGGARPTDEEYRKITEQKPLTNRKFFVRKGIENNVAEEIILEFTTDEKGFFSIELPKGDYVIIDMQHKDINYVKSILSMYNKPTEYYSAADSACMKTWLATPLASFSLDSLPEITIGWNIHSPCSWNQIPCVSYSGPLPP
jgi:hypothetical protein